MNEFYVDNKGYQKLVEDVAEAERKLKNHRKTRGDSYSSSAGDGWHDNFAYEEAMRKEYELFQKYNKKKSQLKDIVIIDKKIMERLVSI